MGDRYVEFSCNVFFVAHHQFLFPNQTTGTWLHMPASHRFDLKARAAVKRGIQTTYVFFLSMCALFIIFKSHIALIFNTGNSLLHIPFSCESPRSLSTLRQEIFSFSSLLLLSRRLSFSCLSHESFVTFRFYVFDTLVPSLSLSV